MAGDEGHHAKKPLRARRGRRALRAVFAADVAGFSSRVSVDETAAFQSFGALREIALEQLKVHNGWLFGMPGDGIFALFESAIDAVKCGQVMQAEIAQCAEASGMRLRIGIHLGEVRFDNDLPFGATLAIAARLEALSEPGGILVSASVVDAVAARVSAIFEPRGTPQLKNIPRQIATFAVLSRDVVAEQAQHTKQEIDLDRTTHLNRDVLREVRDSQLGRAPKSEATGGDRLSDGHCAGIEMPSPPIAEDVAQPGAAAPAGDGHVPQRMSSPGLVDRLSAETSNSGADESTVQATLADNELGDVPPRSPAEPAPPLPASADEAPATEQSISPELKDLLIETLAHHVGPLAAVLVERFAKDAANPDELVNRLENHVPSGDERTSFRLRATRACLRYK